MKKVTMITLILIVALSTALSVSANNLYNFDDVKDIILAKAPDANITEVDLDYERGVAVYEVDYYSNGVKCEAVIDASTGQILYEKSKNSYNKQYNQTANNNTAYVAAATISLDEAKATVLSAINASDAVIVKEELDQGKRHSEYEFEIVADGYKYDAEVDATTGQVTKLKQKAVDKTVNTTTYSYANVIDAEEAKYIASSDAGVTNPVYTEVDFKDKKKGPVYEIEFVSNGTEYEYKIDAATGTILKRESEWND